MHKRHNKYLVDEEIEDSVGLGAGDGAERQVSTRRHRRTFLLFQVGVLLQSALNGEEQQHCQMRNLHIITECKSVSLLMFEHAKWINCK